MTFGFEPKLNGTMEDIERVEGQRETIYALFFKKLILLQSRK